MNVILRAIYLQAVQTVEQIITNTVHYALENKCSWHQRQQSLFN